MTSELVLVLSVFVFAFGAAIASFLNVVIWRVPRGESIVRPASHCPKCGAAIRPWQNVPILSWLFLRGRCASCRAPISPRYILVETLGGILFLAAFWRFGTGPDVVADVALTLVAWVWLSLMITGSFIDYDLKLLPDFVTVGGMALGVAASTVAFAHPAASCPIYASLQPFRVPLLNSLCGLAFGFGFLGFVRWAGGKVFRREAMGLGDVFLLGAVGALFGPVGALAVIILSSLLGAVAGVALIVASKVRLGQMAEIPFGPYICLACVGWMFFGQEIVGWYLGLFAGVR